MVGKLFVFVVLVVTTCNAQVVRLGSCPAVEVVNDFDVSKYVGKWYEMKRFPFVFEALGECVTAEYSANDDGTIGVLNKQINSITKYPASIKGIAEFSGPKNEAKLNVGFDNVLGIKGTYWVLGTDYDSYSVVWSCNKLGIFNFQTSWLLTRDAEPSNTTVAMAYEIISKNNVDMTKYEDTNQKNCPAQTD